MSYLVGVFGIGYVGWPLVRECATNGIEVVGIDLSPSRIEELAPETKGLKGKVSLSSLPADAADCNVYVVCVPTPVDSEYKPDYSSVVRAMNSIGTLLSLGDLVVLESTVAPGTTRGLVRRVLESKSGLVAGRDFNLAFSPERIDPLNQNFVLRNTPKIVGGLSAKCLGAANAFYESLVEHVHPASGLEEAEAAKILENTYRLVNISLINQVADVFRGMEIDVREVIRLAETKPFGFQAFHPSVGAGGHCIPVDPQYLIATAQERLGYRMTIVEEAAESNRSRPRVIADRILSRIEESTGSANQMPLIFLGLSYKPNVGDFRESRQLELLREVCSRGINASYHDFFLAHPLGFGEMVETVNLAKAIEAAPTIVLSQPHSEYLEQYLGAESLKKVLNASGVKLESFSLL